jgi:hypothetical protein
LKLLLPELGWREEAVPLDQPGGVVGLAEVKQGLAQFLNGSKVQAGSAFSRIPEAL